MRIQTRLLLVFLLLVNLPRTCSKTPLYVGAMFPMTALDNNGWTGGTGMQPAAQMAFDHVNTAGVLTDYELKMIWNDTRVTKCLQLYFVLFFIAAHRNLELFKNCTSPLTPPAPGSSLSVHTPPIFSLSVLTSELSSFTTAYFAPS